MNEVVIYTDGACEGNPGPGGWAAIVDTSGERRELSGGEAQTTNNRMEMLAVIYGLNRLTSPSRVDLYSDSQYVVNGLNDWMDGWKAKGWKTANKKPVKNIDLWQRLEAAMERHEVEWHWIKGHAGHPENERADQLAREGIADA